MAATLPRAANNSRIGTCPHGLPMGACPICNGMGGGGSVKKDNKPKYKLRVDLVKKKKKKTTSAQITGLYKPEELIGKQVIAVVNFPILQVANVMSEILVLGVKTQEGVVLLETERKTENGLKIS